MAIRLIHCSGRYTPDNLEGMRAEIRVGDHVILFDDRAHDMGVMDSPEAIAAMRFPMGGGTNIGPALTLAEGLGVDQPIYCHSDGIFHDGILYQSEAVRASAHFRAGRFKFVETPAGERRTAANVVLDGLARAMRADRKHTPYPNDAERAGIWHQAQAEAYRHALKAMADDGHLPAPVSGGAADGGDLGPFGGPGIGKSGVIRAWRTMGGTLTGMQERAVDLILGSHRTIVAGADGTGRTMVATVAAAMWGERAKWLGGADGRRSLLVLRKMPLNVEELKDEGIGRIATHDEVLALGAEIRKVLPEYGLVVIDDAGDGSDAGMAPVARLVLTHATGTRIARIVDSGPNDDDATVVLTEVMRQS